MRSEKERRERREKKREERGWIELSSMWYKNRDLEHFLERVD
jgi:hypothetical protein